MIKLIVTFPSKSATAEAPLNYGTDLVVAEGRSHVTVEFERQMVDFFVSAADLLGVPKSIAAIYAIIFSSPEPLSFSGVQSRLDISKGSISQGLRVLREVGALKEVSSSADRAERFEPDLEFRKIIDLFIELRVRKQLDTGRERLEVLATGVPAVSPTAAKILRQRLKHLQGTHEKARALLPIVKTVLKLGR